MGKATFDILLIDNSRADITLVEEALNKVLQFRLVVAKQLKQGMKFLQQQHFDLVLLDLSLPDCQHLETLHKLQGQAVDIPILVLSDLKNEALAIEMVEAGAQDYWVKGALGEHSLPQVARRAIERHQMQVTVPNREQYYRALIEYSNYAVTTLASDGTILYESPGALRISKFPAEELIGRNILNFIHQDDYESSAKLLQQILQSPFQPVPCEMRCVCKDGSWIWIEGTATNLLSEPAVHAIVINFHDTTERKRIEDKLRESEDKFKYLFDYSTNGKSITLLSGEINVNHAACEMLGYSEHELNNRKWQDITHPDDIELTQNMIRTLLEGEKEVMYITKRYIHKNGSIVWAELGSSIRRDKNGKPLYIFTSLNDITERKQAEQNLQKSEKRYRLLAEEIIDVVWVLNTKSGCFTYVSPSVQKLRGYTPEEVLAQPVDDALTPESLKHVTELLTIRIPQFMAGGANEYVDEVDQPHKNGSIVHTEVTSTYLINEQGELEVIGVSRDITARKQAEAALQQSEARYRSVISSASDAIISANSNGNIMGWNNGAERLFGYTENETRNQPLTLLLPVHYQESHLVGMERIQSGGEKHVIGKTVELAGRRKDGSEFPLELSLSEWQIAEDTYYTATIRDITKRKQAEELVHQKSEQLRMLYAASQQLNRTLDLNQIYQTICDFMSLIAPNDGLLISAFDPETKMITCRAYWLENKWLDVAPFPPIPLEDEGKGTQSVVIRSGKPLLISDYQEMMKTTQSSYYVNSETNEINQETPPDEEITRSAMIVPLKIDNAVSGVIQVLSYKLNAYTEDQLNLLEALALHIASAEQNARLYTRVQTELKERKQAEEALQKAHNELEQRVIERTTDLSLANAELDRTNIELKRANRLKDEFLSSMSHELRTPLTGILGLSEALQMQTYGDLSEKQLRALHNIEESGRHLLTLINDILDLSKIEAGKLEIKMESCVVSEICQSSLQLTKGMAHQKRQQVSFTMSPSEINLCADARRLKQMLVNLLSNAIKFTANDGQIGLEVQGDEENHQVKFTVWDKGIGIKPEDIQQLFKPFVQLDSSLARQYSGTGLGLSLVGRMAKLHNGRVEVESVFGEGSRFTILLPWTSSDSAAVSVKTPTHQTLPRTTLAPNGSTPYIMIVDDNEMVLETLSDFLKSQQYRVGIAHSGNELLIRAPDLMPDLFLIDIQMPGMDGLETIRRIRAHAKREVAATPVIAVTALAMPDDRERCLAAGANEYLSKPVKLPNLLQSIHDILSQTGKIYD